QTGNTIYTVTVNNVINLVGTRTIAPNSSINFSSWGFGGTGGLYVEIFTNIGSGLTLDEFFLTDPKGYYNLPDIAYYTNQVGIGIFGTQTGLDNYAARISGLFLPPTNGLYRFYVRGDDGTRILMNTNGLDPAGRVMIARNDGANSGTFLNGTGLGYVSNSYSAPISLTNGTGYYFEALLKEGTGGDHLEVFMTAVNPSNPTADLGTVPTPASGVILNAAGLFTAPGNPDLINIAGPPAVTN